MATEKTAKTAAPAKTEVAPAPKKEATPAPKKEAADAGTAAPDAAPAKSEGADATSAAPANYSRGEGQKAVTQAYRDNWNEIFGKKTTKKKKR
jgi:hypothetical protein